MESAAMDLDLSIIDTVPHAWPLYAGKFGDASWTIEFQRSPTSVLRRTLSGVTWRWPRTSEWFQCVPDQMEAAVISEASKLGAGEDLRVIMTTSANHFAQWEILAMKADETNAVDFGLASLPVSPEPSASGLKYNTKFSGAFHQAMAGIFILDTMFWLLDDHPQRSNLPKPHPLYSLNSVPPEFHSKHLGRVCHRLSRWEDHVIASTHLVDQKHSPQTPDVANLRISEALKVLSATPSSWRWGKVLRNMATVAMGLRMFHQPEEFSTLSAESKVETHRALLLACGISPILVLFPELLTTKQREYSQLEFRMLWQYGQPPWVARGDDARTRFLETSLWESILQLMAGINIHNSGNSAEASTLTSVAFEGVDINKLKESIVDLLDSFLQHDGSLLAPGTVILPPPDSSNPPAAKSAKVEKERLVRRALAAEARNRELEDLLNSMHQNNSDGQSPPMHESHSASTLPDATPPHPSTSAHPNSVPQVPSTSTSPGATAQNQTTSAHHKTATQTHSTPAPHENDADDVHVEQELEVQGNSPSTDPPLADDENIRQDTEVPEHSASTKQKTQDKGKGRESAPSSLSLRDRPDTGKRKAGDRQARSSVFSPQKKPARKRTSDTSSSKPPKKRKLLDTSSSLSNKGNKDEDDVPSADISFQHLQILFNELECENESTLDDLPELVSPPLDGDAELIYDTFTWPVAGMDWERRHFVEKDISFRFPVSKFEKIKYDEDETLPYEKRRPSIWRDWQELRELMEGVRPSTSDSSGEGLSRPLRPSSDIKIVHRFSFNWSDQKNLEEIFRKNVVLLLDHSGPQTWDRTHVEELLQLRAETQVPVHVLNQRTLEDPICVSSTSIRDVIDEGLSPNHRALNVLSIPLTSPSSVSTIEKLLDSDTTSWNSTVTHPEALMPSVPPKTKWWGMVTLSGCIHSPHIDASGLCTAIHVAVGYKFFIVATDSASFSLVGLRKKDQSIEECVRRAKWRVVVIPPGGTLFLPAGTMHYAFTPETTCGAPPGAIARGSHFYSWSRLPDTLRALWRLRLTKDAITNAEHAEMFTLLSRMLIDVSNRVETGSADLPAPEDIGALLTIIHQRVDLGYDTRLSPLHTAAVELSSLRADILIAKFKADMPEIFEAWKKEQARLSHWIHDCTDLIPGELSKLQSLNQ